MLFDTILIPFWQHDDNILLSLDDCKDNKNHHTVIILAQKCYHI